MTDERVPERKERACTIEIASPADAEAIIDINAESWSATYPNETLGITKEDVANPSGMPREALVQDWRGLLERAKTSERAHVWVARAGTAGVVGFCFVRSYPEANIIERLYLWPERQGQGIGSDLIEAALAWCGTEKPVRLVVVSYNANAIAFYERHGFQKTGEVPPSESIALPSGKRLPEIQMEKRF